MCSCCGSMSGKRGGCPRFILLTGLGSGDDRETPHFHFHFRKWCLEIWKKRRQQMAPMQFHLFSYLHIILDYVPICDGKWGKESSGEQEADSSTFVIFSFIQHNKSEMVPRCICSPTICLQTFRHEVVDILRGKKYCCSVYHHDILMTSSYHWCIFTYLLYVIRSIISDSRGLVRSQFVFRWKTTLLAGTSLNASVRFRPFTLTHYVETCSKLQCCSRLQSPCV